MNTFGDSVGSNGDVHAIVVTFRPDEALFSQLLSRLSVQVSCVHVIDNTPGESPVGTWIDRSGVANVDWRALGDNLGIATALNKGIRQAVAQGASYVLLSDQDSRPDDDMVAALLTTADELRAAGIAVGCVCPAYFDEVTGQAFSFQVQRPGDMFYSSIPGDQALPWVEIVTAISSGMLIPVVALQCVGGMLEDFFIDDVDIEWCHRARSRGLANFGTGRARLAHSLGDAPFRAWCFGWRSMSEYSTTRLYYRFRNFLLMARLPHVPLRWSIRASGYWLLSLYAHCLFAERRWDNAKAIFRGLRDGVLGRTGRMPGRRPSVDVGNAVSK